MRIFLGIISLSITILYIGGTFLRFIENDIKTHEDTSVLIGVGVFFLIITLFLFLPYIQKKHKHIDKTYSKEAVTTAQDVFQTFLSSENQTNIKGLIRHFKPEHFEKIYRIHDVKLDQKSYNNPQYDIISKFNNEAYRFAAEFYGAVSFKILKHYFDGKNENFGSPYDYKMFGSKRVWFKEIGIFASEIDINIPFTYCRGEKDLINVLYTDENATEITKSGHKFGEKLISMYEKCNSDMNKFNDELHKLYDDSFIKILDKTFTCPFCKSRENKDINKCFNCGELFVF